MSAPALKATGGLLEQQRRGTTVLRRRVLYATVVDATEQVTARRRQE
ncbi:MAG TPA: hypothetical protein VKF14_20275 [Candidatus Dormibacteraeota bacterium]|nr:hypothetical protein [Candidatus Dormibacteraeota bacterium]